MMCSSTVQVGWGISITRPERSGSLCVSGLRLTDGAEVYFLKLELSEWWFLV